MLQRKLQKDYRGTITEHPKKRVAGKNNRVVVFYMRVQDRSHEVV
jgi:hypothetical protein